MGPISLFMLISRIEMRGFIIKIVLFFLIIAVIDFVMGKCFDAMASLSTQTDFGRDNHICNTGTEDVLVIGSSRGLHHYNTELMTDSLGLACYNCSEDGQGILLNYGRLLMFRQRHEPRLVIYDLEPAYDIFTYNNQQFIKWLKPHCDRNGVMDIITDVDINEKYKLLSSLYRYNTEFFTLFDAMKQINEQPEGMGYKPLYGRLEEWKKNFKVSSSVSMTVDSLKYHYMEEMLKSFGHDKIIVVVSPAWNGKDTRLFISAKELCRKYNVRFLDYSNDPKYLHQDKYFNDVLHLNEVGADEFTRDILNQIKTEIIL